MQRTLIMKRVKMQSRESYPCSGDDGNDERPGYDECIFRFVEDEVGCSSPWTLVTRRTKKLPDCNSSSQFQQFIQNTTSILSWSPKQVFERIGCSAKCDRVEFSSVVYSRSTNVDPEGGGGVRQQRPF